jgi:heavy-metal exporter, HME family
VSGELALVRLILGAGEPGKEILHPVAVTIFGGLVSAALLDALITPMVVKLFGEKSFQHLFETHDHGQLKEAF